MVVSGQQFYQAIVNRLGASRIPYSPLAGRHTRPTDPTRTWASLVFLAMLPTGCTASSRATAAARCRSACPEPAGVLGLRAAATTAATTSMRSRKPLYWVRASSAKRGAATRPAQAKRRSTWPTLSVAVMLMTVRGGWVARYCARLTPASSSLDVSGWPVRGSRGSLDQEGGR